MMTKRNTEDFEDYNIFCIIRCSYVVIVLGFINIRQHDGFDKLGYMPRVLFHLRISSET